ncbi:MAG: hypothetical protein PHH60_00485 [Candidatus Margulisbacteria bacterium]|nr:hypothetical protein [Candidatus Margulisiibacteriota bacterium]
MNIWGVMPNLNNDVSGVKSSSKATTNANYNGPSFAESISDIARSANMQVAGGNNSNALQFNRRKEELVEEPFDFEEAEEEILDQHLARIRKMLKDLKK